MAVQETHLTDDHVDEIHAYYKHIHLINSSLPQNPSGAGGVGLIFNKKLTNTQNIRSHVIVPGRAIVATLEWHRGDDLTFLAVYAPTEYAENHAFWETVENEIRESNGAIPKPDIMLGDFNCVEDAVDRFPAKLTRIDAHDNFDSLKRYLRLADGWRDANPDRVDWSWRNQARTALSRIDRIYCTHGLTLASRDWTIELSDLNRNDHSRVTASFANLDTPDIGPGRWSINERTILDEELLAETERSGYSSLARARQSSGPESRTVENNPQLIWRDFKRDLMTRAKRRQRELNCARQSKLRTLESERERAADMLRQAGPDADVEEARQHLRDAENAVQNEIDRAHTYNLSHRSARAFAEGETMRRSWFQWAKETKPRDTIASLYNPNEAERQHVSNSKDMAELAKLYHDAVQQKDLNVDQVLREQAILEALENIDPGRKADEQTKAQLGQHITRDNVVESLLLAKNRSAAGTDGLVYELWKTLHRRYVQPATGDNEKFDLAELMTLVYVDIEKYGVVAGSCFAEGWLCPIYKKGDRSNVANYRPITLLNTDYKIYTKALALKLARAAPDLIHPSQAGFVKGRSITDQTKLTQLIIDYAEATEQNGTIVALDQEKAYDRVRHDYLLRVLEAYELPGMFVRCIQSLYDDAHTAVMINGTLSSPFRVTRGVRQGDPLSCLLFNLAIEPLAAMLRNSDLKGYEVRGLNEKLIASLYADDTTVYLSESDSYALLLQVLERWCLAAGAKFNVQKTELIPLGQGAYREQLRDSRKLNENDVAIPDSVRIAADGEPVRILGSWPGNAVGTANVWSATLDKIDEAFERWERHHPTMNGRSILSQTIAGGLTQYLTAAGGMPLTVEKKLDKLVVNFVWQGAKKHPINMETLRRPKSHGGLNLFCAEERNEAQYISWLGAYLAPPEERPLWAFLADELFRLAIRVSDETIIPEDYRTNPFEQSWRPNRNKLPFILKQILRVADKYHLAFDAPYIPQEIRKTATAWAHPAMLAGEDLRLRTPEARCLKRHHAVRNLDHLEEIAEQDDENHTGADDCECENCSADREEGCRHPNKCQDFANDLLGGVAPKWNLATEQIDLPRTRWQELSQGRDGALESGEEVVFDQALFESHEKSDFYRIFVNSHALRPGDAKEVRLREPGLRNLPPNEGDSVHVVACGSTLNGRSDEARGGYAIHFPDGEYDDKSGRCAGKHQTEERSAALAILSAAERVALDRPLCVVTNSKTVIKRICNKLRANEDAGWLATPDCADVFRATVAALRRRSAETTFVHIARNRYAAWPEVENTRKQAREAARTAATEPLMLDGLELFDKPGLNVRHIRQATALRAIRLAKIKESTQRRATGNGLAQVKHAIRRLNGSTPTEDQIWRATRSKDISRNVRNFQWKGIHGAHKIGAYFRGMPEPWASYEKCPSCGVEESMEHILLSCPDSSQQTIWDLAEEFLEDKLIWSKPEIGTIWGCGLAKPRNIEGQRDPGAERAYRIVVSESAFLAWKLRCEKRIEHEEEPDWMPSDAEVKRRWYDAVNKRIATDRLLTNKRRYGRHATRVGTVLETWAGLIENIGALTEDILWQPGVLVGKGTSRHARGVG